MNQPAGKYPWHERRSYLFAVLLVCAWLFFGPWPKHWLSQSKLLQPLDNSDHTRPNASATDANVADRGGPLHSGFAEVDLTDLAGDLPLGGHSVRVLKMPTKVLDAVVVRALHFDNGVHSITLVSPDLLLISQALRWNVLKKLSEGGWNFTRDAIYFASTHTHSSLGGIGGNFAEDLGFGIRRNDAVIRVADRICKAIRQSQANRKAGELANGAILTEKKWIRNRTQAADPANRWLDILCVRQPGDSKPMATVLFYSAHPTCRPTAELDVSGDYPAALCRHVERVVGGKCMFIAAAVGSMAAGDQVSDKWELADRMADGLAASVIPAIQKLRNFEKSVTLNFEEAAVPLPNPSVKLSASLRWSPFASSFFIESSARFVSARIGKLLLLGTPSDYNGVLAERLRLADPALTTVVTSFNGDYVGYVLPTEYDDLDRYEPRHMSYLGPEFGEECNELLIRLVRRASTNPPAQFSKPR